MTQITESFHIPIYEWKTVDAGQRTIRIKGVALRGDVVSKNNRKYTREALIKATNTWINKPVNVNHDDTKKVGTIKWMDFDEASDSLLYEAEINREPYVTLLRNKSAEIRGLSIQADYLYNRCTKCGKQFYTEEDWYTHMTEEEFVKDIPTEPHGIQGSAISLVLSPEVPGYDGTTYELAEMARQATLRLLETVIKQKKEQENYVLSKIALDSDGGSIAVGKSGVKGLAEKQPDATEAEAEETEEAVEESEEEETENTEESEEAEEETVEEEHAADEAPPEPVEATEVKVKSVAEMQTAECNWKKRKRRTYEAVEKIAEKFEASSPEELAVKLNDARRFNRVAETLNSHTADIAELEDNVEQNIVGLIEYVKNIQVPEGYNDKAVKESIAAIKPYDDKQLRKLIKESKYDDSAVKKLIKESKYDDKPLIDRIDAIKPYDDAILKEQINSLLEKMPQLEEKLEKQTEETGAIKEAYTSELAAYKKDIEEYYKPELEKLEKKVQEIEEKKLKETEDTANKIEELETKVDNAVDKQTGTFKTGAAGNEAYTITEKTENGKDKKTPDFSYRPGGKQ